MRPVLALLVFAGAVTRAELLSPVWVELGEGSQQIARVVVSSAANCPNVQIGGAKHPMALRQPVPAGFPPACEFAIPANTRTAKVNGKVLPLAHADPSRVVVLGDTGCRIKGTQLQDCSDPVKWPFAGIANSAAATRPDLVIHVGDYLYREDPCPAEAKAQCGGTPSGDNWGAWNADFFKPAAHLLTAAPWIFVRGNHESCQRSWRGWFYYLDPRPLSGTCQTFSPPYSVKLGKFQTIDFDSSAVNENQAVVEQVAAYSSQLASLHASNAWLVAHHPFWGVRAGGANQPPLPQTITLQQAWDKASPKGIDVVLSGHTHLFEVLSYGSIRPLQIVAGDGGTNLADPVPNQVNGMDVHGAMVAESETRKAFGYTELIRRGGSWEMQLTNLDQRAIVTCKIEGRDAKCSGEVVKVESTKRQ
jgi:predicted phosphodiesterase